VAERSVMAETTNVMQSGRIGAAIIGATLIGQALARPSLARLRL
jgi:hypothetical protein